MCGIFGQATNNPKRINEANIKILGMFNESRGRSSCGITYDGELYHGMDKDKLFTDFIKGRDFKAKRYPVVFGHTRQSSVGVVNEFNCHPFGFGENRIGDGYKFIMCHNGTLLNYKALATQYDIDDTEEYTNSYNNKVTRHKIDSEIIGEVLFKSKSLRVLSEYNGRAALVWTDTDNPNVIYLWSGKSKPNINDDYSKAEEERPLNVWIESKNNFYFSSLPEALTAIGGKEKNVFQIEYNTVYVVKDGNFAAARKIQISRRNNYHTHSYASNGSWGRDNYTNGYSRTTTPATVPQRTNAFSELKSKNEVIQLPLPSTSNIYDDKSLLDQNEYKGKVYPHKLRFWCNGHTITGIYTYIPDYGYYHLADDDFDATARLVKYTGVKFVNGDFDVHLKAKENEGKVIFTSVDSKPKLYYFIEGVPVEHPMDYKRCMEIKGRLSKGVYINYELLSECSIIPVIEMGISFKPITNQRIILKRDKYSGAIDFLGFEKIYTVKDGNLSGAIQKRNDSCIVRSCIEANLGTNSRVRTLDVTPDGKLGETYNPNILEKAYDNIVKIENEITSSEIQTELEDEINSVTNPTLPNSDLNGDVTYKGKTMEEYIAETSSINLTKQDDQKFLESLHEDQPDSDSEVEEKIQCIINENLAEPLTVFQTTKKEIEKELPHPTAKEAVKLLDDMCNLLETFIIKS